MPVVFASPHSGRTYPQDLMAASRLGLMSLRRSEDAFVDEIFSGAAHAGAPLLCASYARAYVDLNRDPLEIDPDMFVDAPPSRTAASPRVQAGLGAIPRVAGDGEAIYRRKLSFAEAERRLAAIHRPYHATLAQIAAETHQQFGMAVVIDCHSMPSCARGASPADIVLGDRFGAACSPALTAFVERFLVERGYRVARNAPFAGGHTTQLHGHPHRARHALQIEINRGLYMQERSLTLSAGFARVQADMARLAQALGAADLAKLAR
jgi:N-formylglutamate amidohydrolase